MMKQACSWLNALVMVLYDTLPLLNLKREIMSPICNYGSSTIVAFPLITLRCDP
jgi:hypothetical protein